MKIRLPIPRAVLRAWDAFEDWANVELFTLWRFDVLRIDVIIALFFVLCVGWYGYTSGWMGALTGGLAFIFVAMCAQWMWRKN